MKKIVFAAGIIFSCLLLSSLTAGCFSSMSWQTADTVPKGGVEFGAGWSVTRADQIEYTSSDGEKTDASDELHGTLPNPFPDLFMRFGLGDNLDIGFRLFFLGIQGDVKIRLVNSDIFSLAIAPGLSYSRPFIVFGEYALDLPLIITFKLGDHVKLYLSGHGRIAGWHLELYTDEAGTDDIHAFGAGANLGFEFGTKRWFIRPEAGYMNYFVGFEDRCRESLKLAWFTFGLGFGFVFGVEDDTQNEKLDKLEKRINQLESEKALPPGPQPAPAPKAKDDSVRKRADEAAEDLKKEEDKRKDE